MTEKGRKDYVSAAYFIFGRERRKEKSGTAKRKAIADAVELLIL